MKNPFVEKVDFLLVGGGHAHLKLISDLKKKLSRKATILLISEDNYQYYSGMASGFLEGIYSLDEMAFNLPQMCEKDGISFLKGKVTKIDTAGKQVWIDGKQTISYQYLSLDIGSRVAKPAFALNSNKHILIKPLSSLKTIKEWMLQAKPRDCWLLVGGGAAGVEIAFGLRAGFEKMDNKEVSIIIIHRSEDILKDYPISIRKKILQYMIKKKIHLECSSQITHISETTATINNQTMIPYEKIIFATGPTAPGLYEGTDLQVDNKGYMLVDSSLRSISNSFVFGAGDCIGFKDHPKVKKAGVYPVRQSSFLCENLVMLDQDKQLKAYRPQHDYLSIMSLGQKEALLYYKAMHWIGPLPWKIKNWIDMKFVH